MSEKIIYSKQKYLNPKELLFPIETDLDDENSNKDFSEKKTNEFNNDDIDIFFRNKENQNFNKGFYDNEDSKNELSTVDTENKNLNQNLNNQKQNLINNNNNLDKNSLNKNNESQNSKIEDLYIEIEINNSENDKNKNYNGKKRGIKKKNENNGSANESTRKFDCDDIGDRIKNNFHDFIINDLNIKIKENFGTQIRKLRKIEYEIIDGQNIKDFFGQGLGELLKNNISEIYKNRPQNEKNINYILKKEKINYFKNLFKKPVGYFFKNYFIKDYFVINKHIKKVDEELILEMNKKKRKKNKILNFYF